MDLFPFVVGFVFACVFAVLVFAAFFVIKPWFRGFLSGARVPLFTVIGMRLRGSPAQMLLDAHIAFLHRGNPIPLYEIESHYLAHKQKLHSTNDLVRSLEDHQKAMGNDEDT